jgi:UDP-glucose 4-epimerase
MKKKIIVTGGAGFIGSHLIENLIKEKNISKIILIDNFLDGNYKNISSFIKNKKIKIVKKDINNIYKEDKNFKKIDCVFHLAAIADIVPSIKNPLDYCSTNIIGTIKILEAMRYNKINKIIFAASSSCYGIPNKYPTDEKQKIDPKYPYAFSKYVAEQAIIHWSKVYKISYISLRLFNVYGLRSRTTGAYGAVMGVFLKQKIDNKPLTIVGTGNQQRDFINVKDVCNAFVKAFKSKNYNNIYNIGSSKPKKILELTKLFKNKIVHIPKRPGEPFKTFANIDNAIKHLNWKPKIFFEDGVQELLKNINYWKDAPLWNVQKIKKATKEWFKYLKKQN